MRRIVLDLGKRVFTNSPPIIYPPSFKAEISGFSTVQELIARAAGEGSISVPFEKELALYLLLIASLWPNDRERLVTAARLFAGALNWSAENELQSRAYWNFRERFPQTSLQSFNQKLFKQIGGPYSLIFCENANQFHDDVWSRIGELTVLHDVIEFLFKASALGQRFSSLSFAFHAIAHNVLCRIGGYPSEAGQNSRQKRAQPLRTALARRYWHHAEQTAAVQNGPG
jgi:hypothetical protein